MKRWFLFTICLVLGHRWKDRGPGCGEHCSRCDGIRWVSP